MLCAASCGAKTYRDINIIIGENESSIRRCKLRVRHVEVVIRSLCTGVVGEIGKERVDQICVCITKN